MHVDSALPKPIFANGRIHTTSTMEKTAENTKTATKKAVATKGVMAAVKAVIGEEPDTFADVDEHPGSLDFPVRLKKVTSGGEKKPRASSSLRSEHSSRHDGSSAGAPALPPRGPTLEPL